MIRSLLGLRLDATRSIKDQIRGAASAGARGVVVDASGELSPDRLSETGRREVRHALRSVEQNLIALSLPTRRPFDTLDQIEDRLARADKAFTLAYELGTKLVIARMGGLPPETDLARRSAFTTSLQELSNRADHRGVRFAIETGTEPNGVLGSYLATLNLPMLAVSLDPSSLLRQGVDPVAATRELGPWVAHAYANDASKSSKSLAMSNPRGAGFPPGALDWEEYLGALEEINYRGYLTVWPDPNGDAVAQFLAVTARLKDF